MLNKYQSNLYLIIIISFIAYSCAPTYDPVYPEPVNIKTIIKPGDSVKITTKDNKEYEFIVVEITEDAIVGESEKVLFTEINKLQEMTVTSGENTGRGVAKTLFYILMGAGAGASSAAGAGGVSPR